MACGCGQTKTTKYEVTKRDGTKVVVNSISEAQAIVRNVGGAYKAIAEKAKV